METIEQTFEKGKKEGLPAEWLSFKLFPLLDDIVEYLIEAKTPNLSKKQFMARVMQHVDANVFDNAWNLIRNACEDLLTTVHHRSVKVTDEHLGAYLTLEYFLRHKANTSRCRKQLDKIADEKMKHWIQQSKKDE